MDLGQAFGVESSRGQYAKPSTAATVEEDGGQSSISSEYRNGAYDSSYHEDIQLAHYTERPSNPSH